MMKENDLELIDLAQGTRSNYEFIDSLIPKADTEECQAILRDRSHWAFKTAEAMVFDRDYDDDYEYEFDG